MDKLNFERIGGPYGDATSSYDVSFPKGMNLYEFIKAVLLECPDEWGDFRLEINGSPLVNYRTGDIYNVSKELSVNLEKEVVKATGHGGWGNMDYILELKDPEPIIDGIITYDENEYWGHWIKCSECKSKGTPAGSSYCCQCGHRLENLHQETQAEWRERFGKEQNWLKEEE